MDGISATIAIRKNERYKNLPVVAMTANAMQSDRERCLAAGMNDHVAKPIEPEDLWRALLKWVRPHHLASIGVALETPRLTVRELPVQIEGLDMVNNLRRVLGNQKLLLSILRKFVSGQKHVAYDIRKALLKEDWSTTQRIAHTLKGVAGSIGAIKVQDQADAIEKSAKARRPRILIEEQVFLLEGTLSALISELELKLPKVQKTLPVVVDEKKLRSVSDQLEALLADDNAQAVDLLDAHADFLAAALPGQFKKISESIHSFDFESALIALRNSSALAA
jgi:HPt (histidine-containing phosphotransfer) domain-containing protein